MFNWGSIHEVPFIILLIPTENLFCLYHELLSVQQQCCLWCTHQIGENHTTTPISTTALPIPFKHVNCRLANWSWSLPTSKLKPLLRVGLSSCISLSLRRYKTPQLLVDPYFGCPDACATNVTTFGRSRCWRKNSSILHNQRKAPGTEKLTWPPIAPDSDPWMFPSLEVAGPRISNRLPAFMVFSTYFPYNMVFHNSKSPFPLQHCCNLFKTDTLCVS